MTSLVHRIVSLNPGCYFLNATAIRNPKTYEAFKASLEEKGFIATEEPAGKGEPAFPLSDRYIVVMEKYEMKKKI